MAARTRGVGHVDTLWYAGCAALAIDRVSTLTSIRSTSLWAQSAELEAGPLRVSVVYDYRDELVYIESAGLPDLPRAVRSLRERGFSASEREAIFLDDSGRTVESRVHRHGRWGRDPMNEVGQVLWFLNQIAIHGYVPDGAQVPDATPLSGRSTHALARAAGRTFRPWRLNPVLGVLRVPTSYGDLIVHARLDGGARWLARMVSTEPPPDDSSIGLRWIPSVTGRRPEQLALVWSEPTKTTNGTPIPALSDLLAVVHR